MPEPRTNAKSPKSQRVSVKGMGRELFYGGGETLAEQNELATSPTLLEQPPAAMTDSPVNAPDKDSSAGQQSTPSRRTKRGQTNLRTTEPSNVSAQSDLADNSADERSNERSRMNSSPITQQTDSPSRDRSDEQTNKRTRIRHSFDIYQDQLFALGEIQVAMHKRTGTKPKLGDLVQDALDAYLENSNRPNERTNERRNGRSQ